ncbi:hypothetical protein CPLU01_02278 [Colletotrichum plurivorum]|uniref:Uncharacterized protein n=1 Tax=Colletotrichum plurivorum TaxID=2175906 RepID=A0A8H6NN59_9PEZI|nr:hypothetical protein CPLU01_02278 [Colletotrichum plurivorum]
MCHKVYYIYACSHEEMVIYRCPKSKCRSPGEFYCRHRPEPVYTRLGDDCFDCDELRREMEEHYHRTEARRIQQQQQSQSGIQSQMHDSGSQGQDDEYEDPRIAYSGKGKEKALRPLETSKLSNMDCSFEGSFGLTPSDIHYFQPR